LSDLRELRYLVTIVDEGQMSKAAKKLHVAQPALSHTVRKLEQAYGVSLLERHARGVRVTPQGAEFVAKARAVLAEADELEAIAKAWATPARTELVLGALPMSLAIIEPLLARLAAAHPDVRVTFRQLDFAAQRAELRRGHIDVEITCPLPTSNEFAVIELARVGRVAWLASNHPLATQSQLTMDQVRDLPVPGRHPDVPEDWWDEIFCRRQRTEPPRAVDRQPRSPEEIWPLITSGEAISISPQYVVGHFPGAVSIPIIDAEPLSVGLLHRLGDQRPVITAIATAAMNAAINIGPGASAAEAPREIRD
jgi:DNA-binding transcriptional LysR family regulator